MYNVKYVHVYDSTPRVVYVGYTPGYTGSYVYHNTLFYGTGWRYRPWISPYHYYPRHSTWGFHVNYDSWSGWNFGLSWGWGPFHVSFFPGGYWHHSHHWHHRHHGYWGPRGYRPRHYRDHRYDRRGYAYNDYDRGGRGRNADNAYRSDSFQRDSNLYRDGSQQAGVINTRDKQPRIPGGRAGDTRKAKYLAATGSRIQKSARKEIARSKQAGPGKTAPVKSSDLRRKADLRDANLKASRSQLLADNSRNVYRKPSGSPDRNKSRSTAPKENRSKSVKRSSPPARSTKSEAAPPRQSKPDISNPDINRTSMRSSGKSKTRRKTGSAEPQATRRQHAVERSRLPAKPGAGKRDSLDIAAARPPQKRVAESRHRQQSSPVPAAPVRLTQQRSSSYRSGQQPARAVSASASKQYRPPSGAKQQRSPMNGPSYTRSSKVTRQSGTHKPSSQRYSSGGSGGKRAGDRQSKRP